MLIDTGLNFRAAAARMGHANPNVTLAVYSHALQSADKQAAIVNKWQNPVSLMPAGFRLIAGEGFEPTTFTL